jgi:hypothetical protein
MSGGSVVDDAPTRVDGVPPFPGPRPGGRRAARWADTFRRRMVCEPTISIGIGLKPGDLRHRRFEWLQAEQHDAHVNVTLACMASRLEVLGE